MPYILPENRGRFDKEIRSLARKIAFPGELNYVVMQTMMTILKLGQLKMDYEYLSRLYADAHLAAEEFRRRVLDPYENYKAMENGDVDGLE